MYPQTKGIIMNLTLPYVPASELYAALKKIKPDIRIIVTTGIRPDQEFLNTIRQDENAVVEKPYSMDTLLAKCREIFAGNEQ
jgi:DNA-binding NarL/FixJ family response regulator